jgi:hypothetical protein
MVSLLCATGFTGCVSRQLVSLDNRYERTRLPVHFDRTDDADVPHVSVSVGAREKKTMAYTDSGGGRSALRNAAYSVDGAFLTESWNHHFGLNVGASPADHGLLRLGAFWGYSARMSPALVASFAGGIFMNNNLNNGEYIQTECALFIFCDSEQKFDEGLEPHMEIPLRANLLLETKARISPFVGYSVNLIGVGMDGTEKTLGLHEVSAGAQLEVARGSALQVEGSASQTQLLGRGEIQEGNTATGTLLGLRVAYVKSL